MSSRRNGVKSTLSTVSFVFIFEVCNWCMSKVRIHFSFSVNYNKITSTELRCVIWCYIERMEYAFSSKSWKFPIYNGIQNFVKRFFSVLSIKIFLINMFFLSKCKDSLTWFLTKVLKWRQRHFSLFLLKALFLVCS